MFSLNFGGLLKLRSPRFPFDIENPSRRARTLTSHQIHNFKARELILIQGWVLKLWNMVVWFLRQRLCHVKLSPWKVVNLQGCFVFLWVFPNCSALNIYFLLGSSKNIKNVTISMFNHRTVCPQPDKQEHDHKQLLLHLAEGVTLGGVQHGHLQAPSHAGHRSLLRLGQIWVGTCQQ